MNLQKITLNKLAASAQPRPLLTTEVDKLASSIKEIGLIQPITVIERVDIAGIAEQGWQIVAGHHRVAACRALGWTEIDALVIDDATHLQSELMEIDENLCRAELTASQRTSYTKRRKQIWEALHPEELEVRQVVAPQVATHGGARLQTKGFATSTAEITGESVRGIQRHIARADALGNDALTKVANTSLDSGVELDALAKLDAPERAQLIERAVAGEQVSARAQTPAAAPVKAAGNALPLKLKKAVQQLLKTMGCDAADDLVDDINKLPELSSDERAALDSALDDLTTIGTLMGAAP